MKLIIKLAIAALIANASWRVGIAYVNYYRFKDSVQAVTQFRGNKSEDQIRQRILAIAAENDIPITEDALKVRTTEYHTIVECAYTRVIELAPGFKYTWPFSLDIDTFSTTP